MKIVQLDWNQVIAAEGKGGDLVTSIARLDGDKEDSRLAQVLDVEQILRDVIPNSVEDIMPEKVSSKIELPEGTIILAADDSPLARSMMESGLKYLTKSYLTFWEKSML